MSSDATCVLLSSASHAHATSCCQVHVTSCCFHVPFPPCHAPFTSCYHVTGTSCCHILPVVRPCHVLLLRSCHILMSRACHVLLSRAFYILLPSPAVTRLLFMLAVTPAGTCPSRPVVAYLSYAYHILLSSADCVLFARSCSRFSVTQGTPRLSFHVPALQAQGAHLGPATGRQQRLAPPSTPHCPAPPTPRRAPPRPARPSPRPRRPPRARPAGHALTDAPQLPRVAGFAAPAECCGNILASAARCSDRPAC